MQIATIVGARPQFINIFRKSEIGDTLIKEDATLGINCTIVGGHTLDRFAFLGAGTLVLDDVPDYALIVGNPAAVNGWICRCAIRLHFDGEERHAMPAAQTM